MRFGVFAVALAGGTMIAELSYGACARPDAPACAIERGGFARDRDADECRKEMLSFRDAMDVYAACRGKDSSDDEKAAREEFEDVRARFNRRARGEVD